MTQKRRIFGLKEKNIRSKTNEFANLKKYVLFATFRYLSWAHYCVTYCIEPYLFYNCERTQGKWTKTIHFLYYFYHLFFECMIFCSHTMVAKLINWNLFNTRSTQIFNIIFILVFTGNFSQKKFWLLKKNSWDNIKFIWKSDFEIMFDFIFFNSIY